MWLLLDNFQKQPFAQYEFHIIAALESILFVEQQSNLLPRLQKDIGESSICLA